MTVDLMSKIDGKSHACLHSSSISYLSIFRGGFVIVEYLDVAPVLLGATSTREDPQQTLPVPNMTQLDHLLLVHLLQIWDGVLTRRQHKLVNPRLHKRHVEERGQVLRAIPLACARQFQPGCVQRPVGPQLLLIILSLNQPTICSLMIGRNATQTKTLQRSEQLLKTCNQLKGFATTSCSSDSTRRATRSHERSQPLKDSKVLRTGASPGKHCIIEGTASVKKIQSHDHKVNHPSYSLSSPPLDARPPRATTPQTITGQRDRKESGRDVRKGNFTATSDTALHIESKFCPGANNFSDHAPRPSVQRKRPLCQPPP